jgi:hypothetical protein
MRKPALFATTEDGMSTQQLGKIEWLTETRMESYLWIAVHDI